MIIIPQVISDGLPDGTLRLIDNRVMCGDADWVTSPVTVCVLHPRGTKEESRAYVRALLAIVNAQRGKKEVPELTSTDK